MILVRMNIRPAHMNDERSIWRIIGPTIRAGETYALDRDMTEADALAYWLGDDRETFVAEEGGEIIGTYYITNTRAVALWESFGFEIVGRLPQEFQHPNLGYVDALVMFRKLDEPGT